MLMHDYKIAISDRGSRQPSYAAVHGFNSLYIPAQTKILSHSKPPWSEYQAWKANGIHGRLY